MKTVQITGGFRRSTAIGIFYKKDFTVTPQKGETIRDAWYREHGKDWDTYGMRVDGDKYNLDDTLDGGE